MPDRRLSVRLKQRGPIPLDVEFSCGPGDVLAVFGPSGSGKTTILRAIAGLYRPAHAVVRSGDDVWTDTNAAAFRPPHRRAVGFVFQEYALFPHLTAAGNVAAALGHRRRSERPARAKELLSLVHLTTHFDRRPHELSGGERQRVALARALAREPDVLLLDEPFAAVDRSVRRRLQDEVDALRRGLEIPLVLVTHDVDDVVRLATDVLLLEGGTGVACDRLEVVMSRPDLPWLRDAVGLGSVFDAVVSGVDAGRGLAQLSFAGGSLHVPATQAVGRGAGPREDPGARGHPGDDGAHRPEPAQHADRHRRRRPRGARVRPRDRAAAGGAMAPCGSWPRSRATPSPGSGSRPARPCTR